MFARNIGFEQNSILQKINQNEKCSDFISKQEQLSVEFLPSQKGQVNLGLLFTEAFSDL